MGKVVGDSMRNDAKKMMYITTLVFVLSILLLPFNAVATDSDSRDPLILLGNDDLPPITYNDKGTSKGVAVDIAKAIGQKIDYDIKVLTVNWEQAQEMMQSGEADGLLHMNPSPERGEAYDFSDPMLKSEFSMFVQIDNTSIRGIDDLKGKVVGVEPGGYPSVLLEGHEDIEIENIYKWGTSFKALSMGEIDAIIVERWIGEYELANSRISDIKIVAPPIETQYSRIAVRKGDVETLALINLGLIEINADGTLDRIMEHWQGKRVIYLTEDYFQIFYLRTVSLFLLMVALVAIYFVRKYQKLSKKLEVSVKERTEELRHTNEMLKSANMKLERISMLDGLTSIENRRAFDIEYNKAWKISLREGMPLALIMIDIDHFKIFNDTYGHLLGDQILIRIAEVIKSAIKRPGDLAARYGGEEFVVMLVNTTAKGAAIVAEEIRARIEELGIESEEIKSVLTVSLGVASLVPDNEMEPNELIGAADRALYKAKEEGRNKVKVWEKTDIIMTP
jgi:diguanylate cyclase (GGDEF)-like protein